MLVHIEIEKPEEKGRPGDGNEMSCIILAGIKLSGAEYKTVGPATERVRSCR